MTEDQRSPVFCPRPLVGVAAVLLAACFSTLNVPLTSLGLADERGALGLGFDEGAWFSTAFTASQLVMAPITAWLSAMIGARRIFLPCTVGFAASSLLLPLAHDYQTLLILQALRGLSLGAYIPASLPFIIRNMPPRWLIWGLAAYCFRFVFSQNIGAAVEAFYVEHLQWQWIYWQNVAAAPLMFALAWYGMPREPINRDGLRRGDWSGVIFISSGLALLYAGLDQGNRLDWLNSGTVVGLLLAGGLLLAAFAVNELWARPSLVQFRVLGERNILAAMLILVAYSCGVITTSFMLPDYLTRVQGLRALQIGDVLLWVALPQVAMVPLAALLVRVIDARLVLGLGLTLMAAGNWLDTGLTHDWIGTDFLVSQILDAVGLAFTITALVCFTVANTHMAAAATIGATIQVMRLMGTEIGNAGMQTFVRVKEQIYSNLLGLHVQAGGRLTDDAIARLAGRFAGRTADLQGAAGQAVGTLASAVRREAYVLAYIDGFWIIACTLALGLCVLFVTRPPPPNPLTPPLGM